MDSLAQALSEPTLGLTLALQPARGTLGVLEFSARASPDLRTALARLERYSALINPRARFSLEEAAQGAVRVVHRIPGDPEALGRHGNAYTLAWMLRFLQQLAGTDLTPQQAWLAHPETPGEAEPVRQVLGTDRLTWGAGLNALRFDAATLDRSIPGADPALATVLDGYARMLVPSQSAPQTLGERAAERCRELLRASEAPSVSRVAQLLHMSARTLQRQLAQEGLSFDSVLDSERAALARHHLEEGRLSLGELAFVLGYSEPRALARAFKRWTGTTPSEFRARSHPR